MDNHKIFNLYNFLSALITLIVVSTYSLSFRDDGEEKLKIFFNDCLSQGLDNFKCIFRVYIEALKDAFKPDPETLYVILIAIVTFFVCKFVMQRFPIHKVDWFIRNSLLLIFLLMIGIIILFVALVAIYL